MSITEQQAKRVSSAAGAVLVALNDLASELRDVGLSSMAENVFGYYESVSDLSARVERLAQ